MADKPAAVLLHLGPGLGNGLANLHNARRAHVPMVVVVGDHATYHKKYDAPLESDIDALAGTVSGWVRRSARTADVAADAADAITASRTGSVSTLILPADVSWSDGAQPAPGLSPPVAPAVDDDAVRAAAIALRSGEPTVILIGGDATRMPGSGRRRTGRRRHGRTGVVRDVPHPTGTRGGRARGGTAGLFRGGRAGRNWPVSGI